MKRVSRADLDYPGHDGRYYYDNAPYTGIVYRETQNGRLENEQEFREGLPWGEGKSWHPSGTLASESSWVGGVYHGLHREWHENGRPALEETNELGICLWRKRWDEQGTVIEDYRLKEADANFKTLQLLRKHATQRGWTADQASPVPRS